MKVSLKKKKKQMNELWKQMLPLVISKLEIQIHAKCWGSRQNK